MIFPISMPSPGASWIFNPTGYIRLSLSHRSSRATTIGTRTGNRSPFPSARGREDENSHRRRQAEHGCRMSSASTTARNCAARPAACPMSAHPISIRRPGQLARFEPVHDLSDFRDRLSRSSSSCHLYRGTRR
jgi:hypothetical protein